jgi:hypothetical protein
MPAGKCDATKLCCGVRRTSNASLKKNNFASLQLQNIRMRWNSLWRSSLERLQILLQRLHVPDAVTQRLFLSSWDECYLKILDLLWTLQISYNNYCDEYNLFQSQRNILHSFQFNIIYNFIKNHILHIGTCRHMCTCTHLHIYTFTHTSLCTGNENKVMLKQHKTHNILL